MVAAGAEAATTVRRLLAPVAGPPRWQVLAVLGVALVARLAYWGLATPDYAPDSDALHYYELAEHVAAGDGFVHTFPQLEVHATAFRSPLYPVVLGAVFAVTGPSVGAGRLLSLALGLLAVHLVVCLASRFTDAGGAAASGLCAAIFPPLIYNDVALLTEPLSGVLLLLVLLALVDERPALAGVLGGLLVLSRSSAQLVLVVVAAWLLRRASLRSAAVFLGLGLAVLAPWVVRNEAQMGLLGLTSANGFNLSAIYSEAAQESGGFVDPVYHPAFDDVRLLQFDEAAWNAELVRRGLAGLRAHPTYVVGVVGRNVLGFTELTPSYNRSAEMLDGRDPTVRTWTSWLVPVVVLAGGLGLWSVRDQRGVGLAAAVGGYFVIVSLVSIAAPRLRAPADLLLCVGVGALVARVAARRASSEVDVRA